MLLSRRNHFTLNEQRFYKTYIFELLFYSLSFCFLRFQNPLQLVFQILLNGNLRRKYLPHFCDFKISLSNAFLCIRGQLNGFLFLRISVSIIFLDIIFDLITTFQTNGLSLRLLAVVNAPGKFYSVRQLRRGQPKGRNIKQLDHCLSFNISLVSK